MHLYHLCITLHKVQKDEFGSYTKFQIISPYKKELPDVEVVVKKWNPPADIRRVTYPPIKLYINNLFIYDAYFLLFNKLKGYDLFVKVILFVLQIEKLFF